jgi:type III restriction enzyme
VLGVPFDVVPFKASTGAEPPKPTGRTHVYALPERGALEIRFPRVEGYTQAIRQRVRVDWERVPSIKLDPMDIPPEVEMQGLMLTLDGRASISTVGRTREINLVGYRAGQRAQALIFDLAADLTRNYLANAETKVPAQALFSQMRAIADRYVKEKVIALGNFQKTDVFLSPFYGHVVERLKQAIHPDGSVGEAPELPIFEQRRGDGSTSEVDFWTNKPVRVTTKSHVNYIVADTARWEQSAAVYIDRRKEVGAWVKNAGLGFAIPYLHNGQMHDFIPDFIIRLAVPEPTYLILETKGYDPLDEVKGAAAQRWVNAVTAAGKHGRWVFRMARNPNDVPFIIEDEYALATGARVHA